MPNQVSKSWEMPDLALTVQIESTYAPCIIHSFMTDCFFFSSPEGLYSFPLLEKALKNHDILSQTRVFLVSKNTAAFSGLSCGNLRPKPRVLRHHINLLYRTLIQKQIRFPMGTPATVKLKWRHFP